MERGSVQVVQLYSIYPFYTIIFFYKEGYRDDLHDLHTNLAICQSDPFLPAPDARRLPAGNAFSPAGRKTLKRHLHP